MKYIDEINTIEETMTKNESSSIMERWFSLFPLDDYDQSNVSSVYDTIVENYLEPERYYHNLSHIESMLDKIDEMTRIYKFNTPQSKFIIYCATFFHDIIYDTHSNNNEELSAQLANDLLKKLGVKKNIIKQIIELILITENHKIDSSRSVSENLQKIIIDADISIMAAPVEDYLEYAKNIRYEYKHIDDRTFRENRTIFLSSILNRDSIFNTEYMKELYEKDAKDNIKVETNILNKLSIEDLLNDVSKPEE